MTPERKPTNTNIEPVQHTGQLEGELQELPVHEDAPSVQDLNTGELEKISPDHSGELVLTDEERTALRAKLAEMRTLKDETAIEAYKPTSQSTAAEHDATLEEPSTGKKRIKKALWYTATVSTLAGTLFAGVQAMHNNDKKSELDIWNQTKPTAAAPLVPEAPQATETPTETYNPNKLIGTVNDVTIIEAGQIEMSFFPNTEPDKFQAAMARVTQPEVDQIREAMKGYAPPQLVPTILAKYGFNYK